MLNGISITERAFQLARSGRVSGIPDIRQALKGEGYSADALQGPALCKQLRAVIKAERQRAKPST